jgi:hypothetical protein
VFRFCSIIAHFVDPQQQGAFRAACRDGPMRLRAYQVVRRLRGYSEEGREGGGAVGTGSGILRYAMSKRPLQAGAALLAARTEVFERESSGAMGVEPVSTQ